MSNEFEMAVIEHLGPAALAGGKMSVFQAFELGWQASRAQPESKLTDAEILKLAADYGIECDGNFHRTDDEDRANMVEFARALLAAQPAAATVPEWISVTDRLPEDDVEVLINGSEGVEIARYMLAEDDCPDSMGHDAGWCGYKFAMPGRSFGAESYMCKAQGQPTHWMPLPQPPAAPAQDDGENMHTQSTHQENVSKNEPLSYACDKTGMMMPSRCGDCLCWSQPSLKAAQSGRG